MDLGKKKKKFNSVFFVHLACPIRGTWGLSGWGHHLPPGHSCWAATPRSCGKWKTALKGLTWASTRSTWKWYSSLARTWPCSTRDPGYGSVMWLEGGEGEALGEQQSWWPRAARSNFSSVHPRNGCLRATQCSLLRPRRMLGGRRTCEIF